MRFTRRFAAAVLLVAIVGLTLAIVAPLPARGAGAAPVLVTNTPTQPVPVALQGTGSVAGTVNALQSGPWTVGVSSLPAVQLAAGTAITLSSSPAAPIYNEPGPPNIPEQQLDFALVNIGINPGPPDVPPSPIVSVFFRNFRFGAEDTNFGKLQDVDASFEG
jgi:hypothetical protein